MTLQFSGVINPTQTIAVRDVDWIVTNSTGGAVALGAVLLLPTGSDGYVTTAISVTAASTGVPGANIVADGWFGVVVDFLGGAGAASTQIKVRVKGVVDALGTGAAAWAADQLFVPDSTPGNILVASVVATAGEANKKAIASVVSAEVSTFAATSLRTFLFDGINGFGRAGGAV